MRNRVGNRMLRKFKRLKTKIFSDPQLQVPIWYRFSIYARTNAIFIFNNDSTRVGFNEFSAFRRVACSCQICSSGHSRDGAEWRVRTFANPPSCHNRNARFPEFSTWTKLITIFNHLFTAYALLYQCADLPVEHFVCLFYQLFLVQVVDVQRFSSLRQVFFFASLAVLPLRPRRCLSDLSRYPPKWIDMFAIASLRFRSSSSIRAFASSSLRNLSTWNAFFMYWYFNV